MLHLFAQAPDPRPSQRLRAEPLTRLASLRNALRLADDFAGGPSDDLDLDEDELSARWASAGGAARRCFDRRSAQLVALASDGLQLVSEQQELGQPVGEAAMKAIADELRAGLGQLRQVIG